MPTEERILEFSSRWYKAAMRTAVNCDLPGGPRIRVVTAPYFLATKIEAFRGRGNGDFAFSHDLEDLIFVVNGRDSIVDEVVHESESLRACIRTQVGGV